MSMLLAMYSWELLPPRRKELLCSWLAPAPLRTRLVLAQHKKKLQRSSFALAPPWMCSRRTSVPGPDSPELLDSSQSRKHLRACSLRTLALAQHN